MNKSPDRFSKQGLLKVINTLPLAICVIDKNLIVTLANTATTRLVNKEKYQLIGQVGGKALDCIHQDDAHGGCGFGQDCIRCKLRQTLVETIEKRDPQVLVETTMVFKNGRESHLRISTLPLTLDNEEVVLLSIEDLTQTSRHEQALREKEKLTVAVETIGGICHEINQPLMVIMGMAELLLDEIQTQNNLKSDDFNSGLAEIKAQGERLGRITRKLVNLADYKTRPYLKDRILDLQDKISGNPPEL